MTLGKPVPRRSGCPLNAALEALGDRWSLLIVRDMAFKGATTFREFLEGGEAIATNVLADRLKRLEQQGIVEKSRDPEDSRSWIYTLSPKGWDLLPALVELIVWGARYHRTAAPPPVLREMTTNRGGFIADVRRRAQEAQKRRKAS